MRFLFGPRGEKLARLADKPLREFIPLPLPPEDVTTDALWEALEKVTGKDAPATEAEMAGRFFGVRNETEDGSFDFAEHHRMLRCRCRVINNHIYPWCPEHDAYYSRVLEDQSYRPGPEQIAQARRWNGVDDSSFLERASAGRREPMKEAEKLASQLDQAGHFEVPDLHTDEMGH